MLSSWPRKHLLPNTCSSVFLSIAFLSFEVPNRYPQDPPWSLVEMVFKVRVSVILVSYSVSLGLPHAYMLLNFCLIFLGQPEEFGKVEETLFFSQILKNLILKPI